MTIEVFEIWGAEEINNGTKLGTKLLVTQKVYDFLMEKNRHEPISDGVLPKLKYMLINGFELFTNKGSIIEKEWDGVYRIFIKEHYRIIGFFYKGTEEFIAIEYFEKKRQSLSATQKDCINKVAEIKKNTDFKRITK